MGKILRISLLPEFLTKYFGLLRVKYFDLFMLESRFRQLVKKRSKNIAIFFNYFLGG